MPSFAPGPNYRKPFGKNVYLGSTRNLGLFESATCAKSKVPVESIDGHDQKVLQPGTLMATVTAVGADKDKVGPFQLSATDGRQTVANIVGVDDTFLPWQLLEHDEPISVLTDGVVMAEHCFILAADGTRKTLAAAITAGDLTVANLRTGKLDIRIRKISTQLDSGQSA